MGRTQFASEAALEAAQAQRLRDQTAIEKAQIEADKIANLRREMNDLRQARISERVRAREGGVELAGVDPFRTLGTLRARAVQGPTIIDQFKQELGQAASFQEPMLGPGASIADLESAITKMSQPILPQGGPSSPFRPPGLEKGGEIGKEGEVKPFGMGRPDPFTAIEMAPHMGMTPIIVGERSGGPELMLAPKGTKVIPLTDDEEERMMSGPFTGMATGGTVTGAVKSAFGTTGTGPNYGLEGFQDLLRGLRERLGLGGRLFNQGYAAPSVATSDVLQRGQAAALGAYQRAPGTLVQSTAGGAVFIVDENGRLRGYTSSDVFKKSGQSFSNVQQLLPQQMARFERGANITSPFTLPAGELGQVGALGAPLSTQRGFQELFTAQGIPAAQARGEAERLANLIGFLPAPHKVGALFNRLAPSEQSALLSAYRLAGVPDADVQAIVDRSGIQGRARIGTMVG